MNRCDDCVHKEECRYFTSYDTQMTEEENFMEHCVGCSCGDGFECNKERHRGCSNWEEDTNDKE